MTPLKELEHLTDLVWDSFSGERLSGGVSERDSFESTLYDVYMEMNLSDHDPLHKAGEKIERAAKKLERQTRSWRVAVNLSQEGREVDIGRWVGDLATTRKMVLTILTSVQKAAKLLPAARATGEYIPEGLDEDTVKEARVAGMKTIAALDTAIKAAAKVPRTASAACVALRHASRGVAKEAAEDIVDKMYGAVRGKYNAFETGMNKVLQTYLNRFGKALLKHDFVMDHRKSYIHYYTDREGIYPEGELHFIDKRDHQQRDRSEVGEALEKLGLYGNVNGGTGVWKIRFGGK